MKPEMVWRYREYDSELVDEIAGRVGISTIASRVLVSRGIRGPEEAFVFPNIFTPNDDGYNDIAQFIIPEEQKDVAEVFVFHTANKLVRQLTPQNSDNFKWDGRDENGHEMEPGVYIYIIKTNGEYYSNGTITLMR